MNTQNIAVDPPHKMLDISGMRCAGCVAGVERALKAVPGVSDAMVSLTPQRARVTLAEDAIDFAPLIAAVESKGFEAEPHRDSFSVRQEDEEKIRQSEQRRYRLNTARMIVGLCLSLPFILQMIFMFAGQPMFLGPVVEWILATIVLGFVGYPFFVNAFKALQHASANMDSLVALGSGTAWIYSAFSVLTSVEGPLYFEPAAVVVSLVMFGRWLEDRARLATTESVKSLMDLRPERARIETADGEITIGVEQLLVGDRYLVKPGDRIPADGRIVEGSSDVDLSMLTGESHPITLSVGDMVRAGTVNLNGALICEVTATVEDSQLAKIIRLVETAQSGKLNVQRLVDRISGVFVPVVILFGLGVLLTYLLTGSTLAAALAPTIAVIVIACPCALGLATPTALVTGIGVAAKQGILIRDVDYLESGGTVDTVVFDKTGTLTEGLPQLSQFNVAQGIDEDELLSRIASVQSASEHPYGKAVLQEAQSRALTLEKITDFKSIPGAGVSAMVGDSRLVIGNDRLLDTESISLDPDLTQSVAGTMSRVAVDGRHVANLEFSDRIRDSARSTIEHLQASGIRCVMLTGDNAEAAKRLADELQLDAFEASLSPNDKADWIQRQTASGKSVAMVGDGINDAPALAFATPGIAVGAGTDVSKQNADVVLMQSNLKQVAITLELSTVIRRKLKQNLFWAFAYNVIAIPVAALGYLSPSIAGAAMAMSSVSVVTNSLLLKTRGK